MGTTKMTFTLDDDTAARIDRTAARLGMSKSRVVREAVREDLAIAACALTWDAKLWTLNVADFRDVPDLVVERPS